MVNNGREYRDPPIKIDVDGLASTMMFSVCGEYLLNGDAQGVQVLQAEGGKQVARMEAQYVRCLAQSKDGRWIAAGTTSGKLLVWDAETYETVFSQEGRSSIHGVDFSPDSSQLVVASWNSAASVWDIATRKEGLTLDHEYNTVIAAKYSPQGDRIATATDRTSVRVWNSSNGCLLVDINATVTPWNNTGLLWSKAHLFIVSRAKMTKIEASTGSVVSEWRVPDGNMPCLAPSQHGEYIAHAEKRTVTFLDTSTHTQLNFIRHSQNIVSIALSPDDRFLAIGGEVGKITIRRLSRVTAPVIQIYDEVLNSWKHDQLTNADESLTTDLSWSTFTTIQNSSHHILASRALVRARLRQWDEAMTDAKESIETLPSIIGYIAKSVVLLGKGERHKAYRACDIAFEHSPSTHVSFLLLIKAIIVFLAGEHDDAISRMDDLIDALHVKSTCYTVQAYMHFLLGNSRMESGDYTGAVRSFERAQAKMRTRTCEALSLVSMIFDWKFDNLTITIQCRLCEALCAAGHPKEAGEVVLQTVNTSGEEVYMSEDLTKWVSDFTQRCLATLGCKGDEVSKATQNDEPSTVDSTLGSPSPSPLLREWARAKLMYSPWKDALTAAISFTASRFMIYRAICERLETIDHVLDVSECFLQMVNELGREISTHGEQATWAVAFWKGCTEKLERLGDAAADTQQHDDAIRSYSAALSVDFPIPHVFIKRSKVNMAMGLWENALHDANQAMALPSSPWNYENVLVEWTKVNLMDGLWKGALSAACDFKTPRIMIYRTLCEGLETVEGIMDAIECFHHMASELTEETIVQGDQAEWFRDFSYRCSEKLERIGDAAVDSQQPDEALKYYSAALSIHPANTQGVFILRSKVYMKKGLWEDALNDANEAITFDSSSPWGYETMRAVLHGTGRYDDAIQSFETMLVKMGQSADPQVRERCGQYVSPSTIQATIRKIVQRTIRHSPRVLINMTTGRLYNKTEQASAFMLLPIVNELVSSMTTRIDRGRIKREVRQFFRYVMLSHKWEENEPLFQQVIHIAVHDLDQSPTHKKLQMFCKIVRDAGFNWAWSDTCCIDKQDHFVLQEALVAMFKWYRGSALTIVYLRGVRSLSKLGDLVRSIWNTRAWTLQEYVASKVIRFYTEDWTPYLNVAALNHKESPEIISEMEQATEVSAQHLTALRPGLSSIRDKLRLASTRHTTLVEDAAYSLLGIFSVSGIPAIYGEGEGALGRLLAHILTGSGDASILAWTGQSGGYNSCLPAHITVFNQPASSHVPPHIEDAEMEDIITSLRGSAPDLELALKLYDRLNELPSPWFAASRMKLPSIAFKLPQLSPYRTRLDRVYRADTVAFGMVEIKTRQDPSRLNSLYLVHPWLDALLDREDMQSGAFVEDDVEEPSSPGTDDEEMSDAEGEDDLPPLSERGSPSTPPRMDTAPIDRETRALRLIAGLRRPFGALLLSLTSTRRRSVVYRRVAADSTITVQLRESVPLSDLLDSVRILDVL